MDWWQALLLAAVPAAITSAALLIQQRSNSRLERVKIADLENDRQHQLRLAAEQRRAEEDRVEAERGWRLASEWRLERREAHGRLLNLMYEAHEDFVRLGLADALAATDGHVSRVAEHQFTREWGPVLSESLAAAQIISSDASAKAAEGAALPLIEMYFSLTSEKLKLRAQEKLEELHSAYHKGRDRYVETARAELAE